MAFDPSQARDPERHPAPTPQPGGYPGAAGRPAVSRAVPRDTPPRCWCGRWDCPDRTDGIKNQEHATTDATPQNRAVAEAAERVNAAHAELRAARKQLYEALKERAVAGGHQQAVHGSNAGYQRHIRLGDIACDACYEGNGWARKQYKKGGRG